MMRPIFPLVRKDLFPKLIKIRKARSQLITTLRKLQLLLNLCAPVKISPNLAEREWAWLYTDASSDGSVAGGPRVAAVILTQGGEFHYTMSDDLPEGRRIDFYEAAAVLLATRTFPDLLRNKRLVVGIDNTVDCYAFVKASHKDAQTATAISLSLLDLMKVGARPFFTYIASERNIADWGSREDLRWLLDRWVEAVRREPAVVEEWRSPGAFLKMLRAVGVDLAEVAKGEMESLVKDTVQMGGPSALDAGSWARTLADLQGELVGEAIPATRDQGGLGPNGELLSNSPFFRSIFAGKGPPSGNRSEAVDMNGICNGAPAKDDSPVSCTPQGANV